MVDGVPKDASAEYPQFYQDEVLPDVSFIEGAITAGAGPDKQKVEEVQADAAFIQLKYQQVVMGRLTAGLDQALSWGESRDAHIQMLAVEMLKDVDTPKALSALAQLGESPNYVVSQAAKNILAAKARKK